MKLHVDAWDPAYGIAFDAAEGPGGPQAQSSAQIQADVELPAAAWRPIEPAPGLRPPGTVLIVDGVQRVDARVWVTDDEGTTHPGVAASYAAGVVRCDLDRGVAQVATTRIERGLFTPLDPLPPIVAGTIRYPARRVSRGEPKDLALGVQRHMRALEVGVSNEERTDGDLLIVDGPLQERAHLPRALGYIKTHQKEYLPADLTAVVTALRAGQRSPVFLLGTSWHRFAWYLRLPGPAGSPWTGLVRAECAADLVPADAVALADLSAVTLPRFASTAYKDPRAPQNLVPIAGLERKLRTMLGDARLLHRALSRAAA
ncbi:hypothetical protein Drose_09090 [Dactylosporangium roseum]|uniref:NurA domain-containing protein n=1 Tax=Dactylosporangium roseum TaxID=47989 RepID=A0ABY5Z8H7_9ACTN|nr:hypothetical protein [Dactylosporangium roseum]UWZ38378.1 hypothetical protein Drose_09090 [Dactylosporangium roseum]